MPYTAKLSLRALLERQTQEYSENQMSEALQDSMVAIGGFLQGRDCYSLPSMEGQDSVRNVYRETILTPDGITIQLTHTAPVWPRLYTEPEDVVYDFVSFATPVTKIKDELSDVVTSLQVLLIQPDAF